MNKEPQLKAVPASTPENRFPRVKITGGPSPADIAVSVDGVEVRKAFDVQLHAGVADAARAVISQFAEIDVDVAAVVTEGWLAIVRTPERDNENTRAISSWTTLGTGRGKTLREAAMAAVEQMDEES